MLDLTQHFTGTYADTLLHDWTTLAKLIQKHTQLIKDTLQTDTKTPPANKLVLSERQINDALNGPLQQFFKQHLNAYTSIARIDTAITLSKGELFKSKDLQEVNTLGVPEALLAKTEYSDLKQLRKSLTELTEKHNAEWESHITQWTETLLQTIKQTDLTFSDLELHDFAINEPASELHNRFVDLKLELPKLKKTPFDFQQYFTLKTTLLIQSALGRSHQSNTMKDIQHYLKNIQTPLKTLSTAEKALIQSQQKAINELLVSIK